MEQESKNKVITISSFDAVKNNEGKTFKYTIVDNEGKKYSLWTNRKSDGAETQAYATFKTLPPESIVEILFNEQEKKFVNKQGKEIAYIDRNILAMREHKGTFVPTSSAVPTASQPSKTIEDRVAALEREVEILKGVAADSATDAYIEDGSVTSEDIPF